MCLARSLAAQVADQTPEQGTNIIFVPDAGHGALLMVPQVVPEPSEVAVLFSGALAILL